MSSVSDDVARMIRDWVRKFCLNRVMTAYDALRAADTGCDAVILSNHSGRNLDGARAV